MKKIILTLIVAILTFNFALANNGTVPIKTVKIIETKSLEVVVENDFANVFLVANYNEVEEALEFQVEDQISFIQIFSSKGELEFQLPVLSNKVKIGKSLFSETGKYKIGFMIDGLENVKFSDVIIR